MAERYDGDVGRIMQGNIDAVAERQRLAALAGPSLNTPANHQRASRAFSSLDFARLVFNSERRTILQGAFPDVYDDAVKFIDLTNQEPWTVVDLGDSQDVQLIGVKYDVAWSRSRPLYPEEISPMTEVFYQCAEVVLDDRESYSPSNLERTLRAIADKEHQVDERLREHRDSFAPKERGISTEEEEMLRSLNAFTAWGRSQQEPHIDS